MKDKKEENKDIIISNKNETSEFQTAIKHIQEQLNSSQMSLGKVADLYSKKIIPSITSDIYMNSLTTSVSNMMNSITPQIRDIVNRSTEYIYNMVNSMNFSNIINEYINQYHAVMKGILKSIKDLPTSRLSNLDSKMLYKYYWVIPFEYNYEKVRQLSKYKTKRKFEKYMIKYFNDNRTKRLFSKLRSQFKEKDKKELLKQIEHSYFNGDYAICITSLMTLFDGATLILLQPSSWNQHNSHQVIEEIKKYMNKNFVSKFGYELYLEVDILNNFIKRLYPKEYDLKDLRRKTTLIRQNNSHGVKYLNNQINVLRLMNALYYCNRVIKSTGLEERFTCEKGKRDFNIVFND